MCFKPVPETIIMAICARARVPIDHARKTKNIQMTQPLIFNRWGIGGFKGSHKFRRDHFLIKISFAKCYYVLMGFRIDSSFSLLPFHFFNFEIYVFEVNERKRVFDRVLYNVEMYKRMENIETFSSTSRKDDSGTREKDR